MGTATYKRKCPFCPEEKKFRSRKDLTKHMKNVHDKDINKWYAVTESYEEKQLRKRMKDMFGK